MSNNMAHALSGAGGGVISMAITYPLVSISSRLQVQKKNDYHYKNTLDTFRKILNQEGISGLYSGFTSGIVGIAVTNGVYYYCYEAVKDALTSSNNRINRPVTVVESVLSGIIAGAAVVVITHPIWTINAQTRMNFRTRALLDKKRTKKPATFIQTATRILKKKGLAGLYAGSKAAMILVINPIIQHAIFEITRAKMLRRKTVLSTFDFFFLGAFSKLIATMITYPYILIKSRMQLSEGGKEKTTSVIENMKKVIKYEGIFGLYHGLNSKIMQSILSSALLFYAKETLLDWSVWLLVFFGARKSMQLR